MQQSEPVAANALGPLQQLGWLAEQPADFQERIARAGRWKTLAAGQHVYALGDPPDALYGLAEGMLDVAVPTSTGEVITFYRAEPGFWVGDSAALAQTSRSISVTAATDCRLFQVPVAELRRMLRAHPGDWHHFYLLSHRNATMATRVVADLLSLSPKARFARMLLRLADADGIVQITHEELGRMAGMSRASFRRAFADLIDSKAVRTDYGRVRILDRAALEREIAPDQDTE
jgi:CRP/FNR family transcriptional regulator, cyclic AMP receptor protein